MKPFEGLIDIYTPQIDLLNDPDGKLLNYFHQLNKRQWFYEAPSPAKTFHPHQISVDRKSCFSLLTLDTWQGKQL